METPPPAKAPAAMRSERRRAHTRARLMAAGREIIGEKGVDGLRISDITEGADVALGSFYNHFSSKEDLVDSVATEIVTESLSALAAASPSEDPAVTIAASIRRFVGLAYEDPEFARVAVNLSRADAVFMAAVEPAAREAIDGGIAHGRFSVPDVASAVITLSGGALALMRAVLDGRYGEGGPEFYAEQTLRTLGVPPDEARELSTGPLPEQPAPAD